MSDSLPNAQTHSNKLTDIFDDNHRIPLPIIPIKVERVQTNQQFSGISNKFNLNFNMHLRPILPDFNFQSLFRKKSHLRMTKNKKKQDLKKDLVDHQNHQNQIGNTEIMNKHIKRGHWTLQENKLYHWFIELHSRVFILKHLRRHDKIFKSMAAFIGSRQPEQCRSHHQKMEKKNKTFYDIILQLRTEFYHSQGPQMLQIDLQNRGYPLKNGELIEEQELLQGSQLQLNQVKEEEKNNSEDYQAVKIQNISPPLEPENLMMEPYPRDFHFKMEAD